MSIKMLLVCPNHFKIGSQLIMAEQGTEFSHVAIAYLDTDINRWMVYHATFKGLHFTTLRNLTDDNYIFEEYDLGYISPEKFREAKQWMYDTEGTQYGFLPVTGLYIKSVCKKTLNLDISNPLSDGEKTWFCSEAAAKVLEITKNMRFQNRDDVDLIAIRSALKGIEQGIYG